MNKIKTGSLSIMDGMHVADSLIHVPISTWFYMGNLEVSRPYVFVINDSFTY